jgi:hypothetical protein
MTDVSKDKMMAVSISETSVTFFQTTAQHPTRQSSSATFMCMCHFYLGFRHLSINDRHSGSLVGLKMNESYVKQSDSEIAPTPHEEKKVNTCREGSVSVRMSSLLTDFN